MFSLEDIRVAVFDFDDTLCIHTKRPLNSVLSAAEYSEECMSNGRPFPYGVAPQVMKDFVDTCSTHCIPMGLISATVQYVRAKAKVEWVRDQYGITMENYCVGRPEDKIHMLLSIAEHYKVSRSEVLLVDDYYDTLEAAADAGFTAVSPMECAFYMEQHPKQL